MNRWEHLRQVGVLAPAFGLGLAARLILRILSGPGFVACLFNFFKTHLRLHVSLGLWLWGFGFGALALIFYPLVVPAR
jgi:hypothetical protein